MLLKSYPPIFLNFSNNASIQPCDGRSQPFVEKKDSWLEYHDSCQDVNQLLHVDGLPFKTHWCGEHTHSRYILQPLLVHEVGKQRYPKLEVGKQRYPNLHEQLP